jgi:hypothetical protein
MVLTDIPQHSLLPEVGIKIMFLFVLLMVEPSSNFAVLLVNCLLWVQAGKEPTDLIGVAVR